MAYSGNIMDVVYFVVSTNDVILNRSCRNMKVWASYIKVWARWNSLLWSPTAWNQQNEEIKENFEL